MAIAKKKPVAKKVSAKKETKTTTAKTATTKAVEVPVSASKKAELKKVVDGLNKKFGANAINIGVPKNEDGSVKSVKRIPTGSIALDMALGGGLPLGRYTEISGGLSTTKTTQCLHIVRNAQQMGIICAWFDVEGTTDEPYLKACGIDTDTLLYSRPDGMEETTQIINDLQREGIVGLAVIDSIAAMSPTKELESTMEETVRMGIPQQLLAEFFRKYTAANNRLEREGKEPFTLIGINQLREKIGAYGDAEYTPGGRAKGFTQSVDIRFRRGDWITQGTGDNKEIVGQVVKFKIEKNKTFKRMQSGSFDFYFSKNNAGVEPNYNDNNKSLVMLGVQWGVIERAGAWFKYGEEKYQGVASVVQALKEQPELLQKIYNEVLELIQKDCR